MDFINALLGVPLGYILYWCYQFIGNYGLAILLFTLATKIILFPLSIVAQKNAIVMVRIKPSLEDIKRRFEGNNTLFLEEQKKLFKQEKYSTVKGILPLLIQIPVILGLIVVLYNPLQHMLHLDQATIALLIEHTSQYLAIPPSEMGIAAQLKVIELVQTNPGAYATLPDMAPVVTQIQSINMEFFGVNLSQNPSVTWPAILYPLLSGFTALLLSLYQNKYYILQKVASKLSKWGMTIFLVAFSGYFAAVLPMGLGLYWTCGNILSILVVWMCNVIYNPKKLCDLSNLSQKPVLSKEQRAAASILKKREKKQEKQDLKRFAHAGPKRLVFYSEASGFYKYYQGIIEWLRENSSVTIHYVTSDLNDQVFSLEAPGFEAYYVGQRKLISFMMRLDADVVVMTMPDLEKYHIKRSLVRKDMEYIYLDHGFGSMNLLLREGAVDAFDTVFCYGQCHVDEIRALEQEYLLPEKRLVATGFDLYDKMVKSFERHAQQSLQEDTAGTILIAPSWQPENILESCFEETVRPLLDHGYKVVVRPHPEFVKRFSNKIETLLKAFEEEMQSSDGNQAQLVFELDFSKNETVYAADIVITDWSTIAQEFSFGTKRPSIFVNTPMKVSNPHWQRIDVEPIDLLLREQLGEALEIDELETIGRVADRLMRERQRYSSSLKDLYESSLFNVGCASKAAGEYLLASLELMDKQRTHEPGSRLKKTGEKSEQ